MSKLATTYTMSAIIAKEVRHGRKLVDSKFLGFDNYILYFA